MNNKGLIITNAFSYRKSAKYQCESLIKSFSLLGIELIHKTNEELLVMIENNNVSSLADLTIYDFVIYLDKDKYISLMLEKMHLNLFNTSQAIDLCDDKMMTHIILANNGLKMPKTISYPLCYEYNGSLKYLEDIKKQLSFPFIIKENYGSLGQQVYLANNETELLEIEEKLRFKPHLYQEYISHEPGIDYRLILIGDEVVASMKRVNKNSFKANIAQGGEGFAFEPPKEMIESAKIASKILNLDYCAIDFVLNSENEPVIIEVNSNAYFTEIEKVTCVNISNKYAQYIYKKVYFVAER